MGIGILQFQLKHLTEQKLVFEYSTIAKNHSSEMWDVLIKAHELNIIFD